MQCRITGPYPLEGAQLGAAWQLAWQLAWQHADLADLAALQLAAVSRPSVALAFAPALE